MAKQDFPTDVSDSEYEAETREASMRQLGKGLATAGAWTAVGLVGVFGGETGALVSMVLGMCALFATIVIWASD